MRRAERPYRSLTTLQIVIASMVILLVGIACLYLGGRDTTYWRSHQGAQALVNNLGAVLIISVGLAAIWELAGKRAFAREVLESTGTANSVSKAGVVNIGVSYLDDPEWDELFAGVRELDVFVAYGQTWRNNNLARLRALASRPNARIRVFIADPDDEPTVQILSHRFDMEPDELKRNIETTRVNFEALRDNKGAKLEISYFAGDRVFSFYRFDHMAVVVLYRHKPERSDVTPTLIVREGGSYYDFIQSELEAVERLSRPAL